MPTLSIRVDDATKQRIEEAAAAEEYSSYAEFLRAIIQAALRSDDAAKTEVIQTSHEVVQEMTAVVQENTLLKNEITLKNEIIAAKEAHITDLQVQVGLLTRLALPPAKTEAEEKSEKKKRHWWQRGGKKKEI